MDGLLNTLKCIYKISVNIKQSVAAVKNWFERCGGCSIIGFDRVLYFNKK